METPPPIPPAPKPPGWADAPFHLQPATFYHSLVYELGDCLRALKGHRDRTAPKSPHCNLQLVILLCAFIEAALNRGLLEAAQFRQRDASANDGERKVLAGCIGDLLDGRIYGSPATEEPAPRSYPGFIRAILGVELDPRQESVTAIRCLFLLRNMAIHGQSISATGRLPAKLTDTIPDYALRATKNLTALTQHLGGKHLLPTATLEHGAGFPFLTDAIVNHFLRETVSYFRSLQGGIVDDKLRHEFGAGIPQNIFPILAGEAFEL